MASARSRYVSAMFGRIAGRYDLMNTLMTFGMDRGWRRAAVDEASPPPDGLALDVGTGTGKLALALAAQAPRGRVFGCDFSFEMMRHGRSESQQARAAHGVRFQQADALALPYQDAVFDCVTTAFTVRNVADVEGAFREMTRVSRPGGRVVCLELTRPTLPGFRALFGLYFRGLVPVLGRAVAGDAEAYTYLPESVAAFLAPERLAEVMRAAGLRDVRWRRLGLGAVALHVGIRPA